MGYHLERDRQQYGPYSVADLQKYLDQGSVLSTDLVQDESGGEWISVAQAAGIGAAAQNAESAGKGPMPPRMHWVLLLCLTGITAGVFAWVWIFIQATFVTRLRTEGNALLYYAFGFTGICLGPVDCR